MTLEEIAILKGLVAREHKSDVLRALEEMEVVEKRRETDRLARAETPAEQEMRERVNARAAELVRDVVGALTALVTERKAI
jgi:hypothetical protein